MGVDRWFVMVCVVEKLNKVFFVMDVGMVIIVDFVVDG